MNKILDLKDDSVIINVEWLSVPELEDIWKLDKTKNKVKATKEFLYLYHITDANSPYYNLSEKEKDKIIKIDIFGNEKYKISDKLQKAIKKYKNLTITKEEALLIVVENKIDSITEYFKDMNVEDIDTVKKSVEIFSKLEPLLSSLTKLRDLVKKEKLSSNERRKAGRETSLFED